MRLWQGRCLDHQIGGIGQKDWINEIKARKGWTDKDIAKYLGVSVRTVLYLKKEPWNRSGELILKLLDLRNKTMQEEKVCF